MIKKFSNFFTKRKIIIIIILAFIVIAGVLLFIFYPPVKYFGSQKFVSNEFNISFYLPKNFREIENKILIDRYNQAAKLGFVKTDSQNASFIIKVDDQVGMKNFDAPGSMDQLKKIFAEKLADFELLYMKESTFKNIPCIETEYIYGIPIDIIGNKQKTQQKQIIFLKDEKLYWLIFASYPEDFVKDNKDFDKILKSFKFQ